MMPITISLLLLLEAHLLSGLVVSCDAFNRDGVPEAKVGWVWDGGTRSTFDILWSCLAVILVCTYKAIHLNVPAEEEWRSRWYELLYWRTWLRKLKWMGLMALSPELLLSMALLDWLWARDSVRRFEQAGLKNKSSLLCHSKPTADIIERSKDSKTMSTTRSMPSHIPLRAWTKVHAHYANMGGFIIRFPEQDISDQSSIAARSQDAPSTEPSRAARKSPYRSLPLSSEQLLMLVEEFSFEIPYVTQEDIMDRSKADVFTKLFAIGQSAWLIVQCIARAAQGLPVTELELATMGLVGCALVMYLLWWDKPFDVQHSLFINCPLKDRDRVIRRLSEIFQERYASKFLSPDWEDFLRERRLRNWAYMNDIGLGRTTWLVSTLSIMGMGMAFCALHLIAWNWAFPSNVENYLWRSAALSATVACIPVAILLPLLENGAKRWQHYIVIGFVYPLCGLYMLCRIILIVQIFICFRSMPEGVYKSVEWTDFLPKVS